MALSGRYAKGDATLVASVPLVVLSVQQPGMLRTMNVYAANNDVTIKIVVDGLTVLNAPVTKTLGGSTPIGQGVEANGGTATYYVSNWGRMLNLPFNKSLEVSISHPSATPIYYSMDYVVDVKEGV